MVETLSVMILKATVVKSVEIMLQKVISSNWNRVTDDVKEVVLELASELPKNKYLLKHVQHTLKMRTLINPNDDVTLEDIYHPLTLFTASNKDGIIIKDDERIDFGGVVNIIGIAGQGKSTVLRKLFLEEIKKGNRIPFFIELRNIEDGDILKHFKGILKSFNVTVNDSNIEFLLQTGKVVLLLDGFDEVRHELTTKILNSITNINSTFACPIIVTSRPNTDICTSPGIYNLTVQNIDLEDKIRILNLIEQRDINSNGSTFRHLCDLLIQKDSFAETICNPIMVTLLYHCFPYMDEVPKDISEFYRQLFGVLYARHDKTKGYNNRQRESGIDIEPARELFSYICLKSLLSEEYELDSFKLHKLVTDALKTGGYAPDKSDSFIKDIVRITCLLQADGNDRFVFLHKSVQEFFAAFYISIIQDNSIKERVYSKIRSNLQGSEKFDNLLFFLFHIDKRSFTEEITLKTFRDCKFNDYADFSYEEISLPFDDALREGILRGESKKNDKNINIGSFSSISHLMKIDFLNVINGGDRKGRMDIDSLYVDVLNRKVSKGDLSNYTFKIVEKKTKDKINSVEDEESNPSFTYEFPLVPYLKTTDKYETFKAIYFNAIKDYNERVYKVKVLEILEMNRAMKDGFDFIM